MEQRAWPASAKRPGAQPYPPGSDGSLTVNLAAGGTAVPGTNYDALPATITIPAGSQTAVLLVSALEDSPGSNDPETVTETIQPGAGYTVGSPVRGC